jgi:hypothetical protein
VPHLLRPQCLDLQQEKKKSLSFSAFPTPHSFSVTFFLPFGLRPFFILLQINTHLARVFRLQINFKVPAAAMVSLQMAFTLTLMFGT